MGYKGLDNEVCELATGCSNLKVLSHSLCQPLPHARQINPHFHQSQFPSALDQLIWLYYQTLGRKRREEGERERRREGEGEVEEGRKSDRRREGTEKAMRRSEWSHGPT